LGTLGISGGNANLFLINPNGIIFGSNASLDVGGSFTATTANAIKLGDTGLFSVSEPATSNLLTVRPSALFFNAVAPRAIVNQSLAQSLSGQTNSLDGPVGLQVPTLQTLALIGGNVAIEGGNLTAAGGRIELGSVAGVGEVSLSHLGNRWLFGYDNIDAFGNIRLEGGTVVDASGEGGGDVQLQGAQLEMIQGSFIISNTLGSEDGGKILIRTTETVALSDDSLIAAAVLGSGTGVNITIATGRLLVRDGAQVSAVTRSIGEGGTLSVTASDSVKVIGTSADGRVPSTLTAQTTGAGNAGGLRITTKQLTIRDGAEVNVSSTATGIAGSIQVLADVIHLDNEGKIRADTSGGGGNIDLLTYDLILRRGSSISINTRGNNITAGNINIVAFSLVVVSKEDSDISINGTVFRAQYTPLDNIRTSVPTEVVDASSQIAQICGAGGREASKNEFIITGRRGMPSNPYEPLSNDEPLADVRPPSDFSSNRNSNPDAARSFTPQNATSKQKPPIVEAQGWIMNDKGQVVLTATASTSTPHNSLPPSATCPSS
jgi:large exoprotein involved in heme utilization and adhesion